jgi:hypothetical protein
VPAPRRNRKLSLRRVVRGMVAIGRRRLGLLLAAGIVIFVPLGLVDVLDETFQDTFSDADLDEIDAGTLVALFGAAFAHAAIGLGGEVLYTGIVAASVVAVREGFEHDLRHLVRTLPYGRLIAADLLLAISVSAGLLVLVVPGLIALARFALVAPAVELERRGAIEAFRRSNSLVRGSTLRMLALVLPLFLIGDGLSSALQSSVIFAVGDTFLGDWLIATGTDLLTAPLFALAVVVSFLELGGRVERPRPDPAS